MIWAAIVETLAANIWPLCFLLVAFLVLKQVKDDVRPIFTAMMGPITKQAQTNAIAWALGMALGVLSSLSALTEVAQTMHWVYVAIACKVLGPGLATIVALVKQSPVAPTPPAAATPPPPAPSGSTNPPFPKPSTP